MTYKTHNLFAIYINCTIMIFKGEVFLIILLLSGIVSLLPDLDLEYSWISQRLKFISFFTKRLKHRGITHSFLGMFIFIIIFYFTLGQFLILEYTLYFSIAYFSHLLSDSLTKSGVNFLYPYKKKFGLKIMATSSLSEKVFAMIVFSLIIVIVFYSFKNLNVVYKIY